ncbi:MAG: inorganic pyrophosphatase Ppa [Pseudomonadota bacterium]
MNYVLQKAVSLELQPYRKDGSARNIRKTHLPFTGTPYQDTTRAGVVILVADPFNVHTVYYEFQAADIGLAEELPSVVNMDEENVRMARLWIRKGAVAVRCDPFRVSELPTRQGDRG